MKLRSRLMIRCLIVFSLLMGLFGALLIHVSFDLQMRREEEALAARSADLTRSLEAAAVNYALQSISLTDEIAVRLAGETDGIAALFGANGQPLVGDMRRLPETDGLFREGETLYALRSAFLAGRRVRLLTSASLEPVFAGRRTLLASYAAVYLLLMALCALILRLAARGLTRPLERLADTSRCLAAGDLTSRAAPEPDLEVGALASAFNRMADALTGQLERQRQFISSLTHEIKTPLAAIIGHADLIRSGRAIGTDAMLSAQHIFREGKRLNALSMRLLDLILLEQEDTILKPLPLKPLLEEMAGAFQPEAERRSIHLEVSCCACLVEAEEILLRTLLQNLTDNAFKSGATRVCLSAGLTGRGVTLSVRDDGRGMNQETLAHIVEPFYRADKARSRAQGGAGLGLSLCARIAALHHTALCFDSAPGQGTTVWIILSGKPLSPDEAIS